MTLLPSAHLGAHILLRATVIAFLLSEVSIRLRGLARRSGSRVDRGSIGAVVVGIALRQWAVWVLGRFFTVVVRVTAGQTVIDRGPYRWVRHPSYTGLLLTLSGAGVAFGNWLSILALIIWSALGLAIRIRVEERALLAALGEP